MAEKVERKDRLFWKIAQFAIPFKWMMVYSVILNIVFSALNTLSVALIKPVIQIVFQTKNDIVPSVNLPANTSSGFIGNVLSFFSTLKEDFFNGLLKLVESDSTTTTLMKFGTLIVLIFFLKNLAKYWNSIIGGKLEEGIIKSIRDKVFAKLTGLSMDFFNKSNQGALISVIANDCQTVNQTIINSFTIVIRDLTQIILFMVLLLSISWQLTLIAFSTSIFTIIIVNITRKYLKRYASRMQKALSDYTTTLTEVISGIRVVKAYNAEPKAIKRFENDSSYYVKSSIKHRMITTIIPAVSEVFAISALTVVLLVGAWKITNKELRPDDLMTFLFTLFSIMAPIIGMVSQLSLAPRGFISAEKIFAILDMQPSVPDGKSDITGFNESIEFKDVRFSYTDVEVLKGVNLKIEKGKKIAFVGASGSGKSTMLDLIIRFYDVNAGDITLDGKTIKDFKLNSYRNIFGLVSQETVLFNDTIANNISYGGIDATREEIENAAKKANAYDFISKIEGGFDAMLGERGSNLSGGERQRIAIARALLKNPPILVFDEATSALDAESEKIVQKAINESLENRTAVIVAHRLSTIKNCDEIVVFSSGEIVERGTHDELIKLDGVYKRLYEIQFAGSRS